MEVADWQDRQVIELSLLISNSRQNHQRTVVAELMCFSLLTCLLPLFIIPQFPWTAALAHPTVLP